ncbi:hypothetical protein YPPY90_3616, partial [Yersinia pestis PY-90]
MSCNTSNERNLSHI